MNKTIAHVSILAFGLLSLIGSYCALFTADPKCSYPNNHYIDENNVGRTPIIDHESCAQPKGLWFDYATNKAYYSVYDIRVVHYITLPWAKAHSTIWSEDRSDIIAREMDNLYIIGSLNSPIIPFTDGYLTKKVTCDYYTRLDELVSRFKLTYSKEEQEYVTRVLLNCTHR